MAQSRTDRSAEQANPVVTIIIVNYNTKGLTAACLDSIFQSQQWVSYEVIVVDNASRDGSELWLRRRFGRKIKLLSAARNLGFGPGNNFGAAAARGDYLLFLNSDTLILPHTLSYLVAFADSHPNYGLLGPLVYLKDQRTVQPASFGSLPTLWRLILRRTAARPRLDAARQHTECEWVTGAALFIPRPIFQAVGGFDSRFFMYFEDQDLCASVRRIGYRAAVVHAAGIIHLGGRSLTSRPQRYALYADSQRRYWLKHHGWFLTAVLLVIRWPWQLFQQQSPASATTPARRRPAPTTKRKSAGGQKSARR